MELQYPQKQASLTSLLDGEEPMSDLDVSKEDIQKEKQQETARVQRKKAGIPELDLDALPSSIATKMTILF